MKDKTREKLKYLIGRVVRIVSIPPLMAALLIAALALKGVFSEKKSVLMLFLFLCVFPVLAYPISYVVPIWRRNGREAQRAIAFVMTALGYIAGFIYAAFFGKDKTALFIQSVYLFSVIILLVFNKLLKLRASGHGCSVTGPVVIGMAYMGFPGMAVGLILYGIVFWASIVTKRHTVSEFLLGTASCCAAFLIALICR